MRYLLLVSHGTFAPGLHSVIGMLFGDHEDVLSCSLEDGMGADVYAANLEGVLAPVAAEDEVIVLADLIGGSPLTNALSVLTKTGHIAHTTVFGGMNLPMAVAALDDLQGAPLDAIKEAIISTGREGIYEMPVELPEDGGSDDEDDI